METVLELGMPVLADSIDCLSSCKFNMLRCVSFRWSTVRGREQRFRCNI